MNKITAIKGKSVLYDAANPVKSVVMTFNEFASIPRNPNQRNEEERVKKQHLRKFVLSHRSVAIAVLPDESCYKLDGHTRAAAGLLGLMPELVKQGFIVTVYSVNDLKDVVDLYNTFDNKKATKSAADTLTGALSMNNLTLETGWLKNGFFATGLKNADTHWCRHVGLKIAGRTPDAFVAQFRNEILLFDGIGPKEKRYPIGVLAACFLFLKKHGKNALPFIIDFNDGMGTAAGQDRDSVHMLHEFLTSKRAEKSMNGESANDAIMKMTLALMKRSLGTVQLYNRWPSPISAADFLR